jgi:SOS-response transcriptional repressor LexA
MSIRDLAEAAGINANYLAKSLGKQGRRISVEEMAQIEQVLAPEDLEGRLRTIPLLGKVPAGKPQDAFQIGGRRIPAPDPETPPNAYALIVTGDSMDLVVPDGTILVIDPDDKALWPDKRYVVKSEGTHEATFKEFQADPARLVPCSSNDEHQDILLGSEPIVILGRVYSYHLKDVHLPRRPRV